MRTASCQGRSGFMEKLTHAARPRKGYPPSEHVEQQIYGAGFLLDSIASVQPVSLAGGRATSLWSNGSRSALGVSVAG